MPVRTDFQQALCRAVFDALDGDGDLGSFDAKEFEVVVDDMILTLYIGYYKCWHRHAEECEVEIDYIEIEYLDENYDIYTAEDLGIDLKEVKDSAKHALQWCVDTFGADDEYYY